MIQDNKNERTVVLGATSEGEAEDFSKSRQLAPPMQFGDEAIPKFDRRELLSFTAEYTKRGDDVIIHFYLPQRASLAPETKAKWMEYWMKAFPAKLEPTVREYFEADYPRLVAKYTEEATSWWFKAQGFGHILDLGAYLDGLFAKLDEALQSS
jgi:hypothetical protein